MEPAKPNMLEIKSPQIRFSNKEKEPSEGIWRSRENLPIQNRTKREEPSKHNNPINKRNRPQETAARASNNRRERYPAGGDAAGAVHKPSGSKKPWQVG